MPRKSLPDGIEVHPQRHNPLQVNLVSGGVIVAQHASKRLGAEIARRVNMHDRLVEELGNMAWVAENAMHSANDYDPGAYLVEPELRAARALLAEARGEGEG